eukprot:736725-Pleurochrysis_carterae.AAC.1
MVNLNQQCFMAPRAPSASRVNHHHASPPSAIRIEVLERQAYHEKLGRYTYRPVTLKMAELFFEVVPQTLMQGLMGV